MLILFLDYEIEMKTLINVLSNFHSTKNSQLPTHKTQ